VNLQAFPRPHPHTPFSESDVGTMLAELIKAWDMLLVFIFVIRTLPIGMSIFAIIVGWYRS